MHRNDFFSQQAERFAKLALESRDRELSAKLQMIADGYRDVLNREEPNQDGDWLRSPNPCAQCGEPLIAARWSEHVNERCIRHLWECDACGYEFETIVYFRAEHSLEQPNAVGPCLSLTVAAQRGAPNSTERLVRTPACDRCEPDPKAILCPPQRDRQRRQGHAHRDRRGTGG